MHNKPIPDVSIVIPVYKSEKILNELTAQLEYELSKLNLNYEVIYVCDRSPDASWEVIANLSKLNKRVFGILLSVNAGQHNAIMAGLKHASGRVIVTMDDDLQHSPRDIKLLLQKINEGYDAVYAEFKDRRHSLWKIIGSNFNNHIASILLKKPRTLYLSPFRAFTLSVSKEILQFKGSFVYLDGIILSVTKNISSIMATHQDRYDGKGNYGLSKSISLWLKMATNFSLIPLRLTSLVGLIASFTGFAISIYLVIAKIFLGVSWPTGWTSLMLAIITFGGIQLLALGIIGEYLGRVLLIANGKQQYIILKTTETNFD